MVTPAMESLRNEAAQFVARMDKDVWSATDEAELQAWLEVDPLRQGVLLQVQAHWLALAPQAQQAEGEVGGWAECDEAQTPSAPQWGRRGVMAGLAASAALAFAGWRWTQTPAAYTTRLGEIRRLPLSDGSVMTMNSGSDLTVTMAQQSRRIELTQGEAWFEVAKDASRPFVVASGDVRVRAVGTAFSVRRRETGVEILVTEGVVETWAEGDRDLRMRLEAGDRAMMSAHAVMDYEAGRSSSVDRALAWRSGMIDLDGRTLYDAADEFNRYNSRQIIIADPRVARERLDGLFRVNDPEGFATAVQASLGASIDTSNPALIRIGGGGD
ncbi:FecR family protein [Novosphingobium gossypii]|uniref:FecR family protein n=1 Tax=Novosphingobium gossypii TaxID=1604774 RepID=UPI003D1EE64E